MSDKVLNIFKLLEEKKCTNYFVETKDGEFVDFEDFSYSCYFGNFYFYSFESAEIYSAIALEDARCIYSSKVVKTEKSVGVIVKDELLLEL